MFPGNFGFRFTVVTHVMLVRLVRLVRLVMQHVMLERVSYDEQKSCSRFAAAIN